MTAAELRRRPWRLIAPHAAAPLLYDLERDHLLDVPPRLLPALAGLRASRSETEATASWLIQQDLLTTEPPPAMRADGLSAVSDLSLDLAGTCNLSCVYCFEKDLPKRARGFDLDTAQTALAFWVAHAGTARHLTLHLGSGESLIRFDLLRAVTAEARRLAATGGRSLAIHLTTNGTLLTPAIAEFLAANGFTIRLSHDGPPALHDTNRPFAGGRPSSAKVAEALTLLLEAMPERLIVNSVLCGDTRLMDLYCWAKAQGIRHYQVIKVGATEGEAFSLDKGSLDGFCTDLAAISADMEQSLTAGIEPMRYRPLVRVVERLVKGRRLLRYCGAANSFLGIAEDGGIYPCFHFLGTEKYRLGDVKGGLDNAARQHFLAIEAAMVDERPLCRDCWARYLCGGGCYADSVFYGHDAGSPKTDQCPFWRAEIEAGLMLYARLRRRDPALVLRLIGVDPSAMIEALGLDGANADF